jgi:hypothetical protein
LSTYAANPHCDETKMTMDTGATRFVSLAILILLNGLILLGYLTG